MSNRMGVQEFMDRMRSFVAEEPDSLSMEQVAMCATMLGWSRRTSAIVLADFIDWIITLKDDATFTRHGDGADLDELVRRAIDVRNAMRCG